MPNSCSQGIETAVITAITTTVEFITLKLMFIELIQVEVICFVEMELQVDHIQLMSVL